MREKLRDILISFLGFQWRILVQHNKILVQHNIILVQFKIEYVIN